MDLSALKQEIQDDAGLLSNWRKAYFGFKKTSVASKVVERSFCCSNKQKGDVCEY